MNTVHLVGKIATDIRVREFPSSKRPEPMVKASFLLAVPPPVKGSRIAISGRIHSRFYDPNGKERGGSLRPTVVADGIDYLTQPRTEPTAPAPAEAPRGRR